MMAENEKSEKEKKPISSMQKIILVLLSYISLVLIACVCFSLFWQKLPELLPSHIISYKLSRGIRYFLDVLPAVSLSGFTIACTIGFADGADLCITKFSPKMGEHYKNIVICSLIFVLVLSVSKEVLLPMLQNKRERDISAPRLLEEYIEMGNDDFNKGKMLLAYGYAKQALALDPKSQKAKFLLDHAQAEIEAMRAPAKSVEEQHVVRFSQQKALSTVSDLIRISEIAAKEERWFDSHYYAQLAVSQSSKQNINREKAKILASQAWNHLTEPSAEMDTPQKMYYRQKKEAYELFTTGNYLESYYRFLNMSRESREGESDPDVVRFLRFAKEKLDKMYFFVDETEDMQRFETAVNVHFKLPRIIEGKNSGVNLIYIKGVTPVKESGGMVQYLRGLAVYSYDENNEFVNAFKVPYAKMMVLNSQALDAQSRKNFGIEEKKMDKVPYIMLESVGKDEKTPIIAPEYEFPDKAANAENYLVLSMPFEDFPRICDSSVGEEKMDLLSLLALSKVATDYGFGWEAFNAALVKRFTYPLEMLILFMFCALFAWSYRLDSKQVFKFKWSLIMPVSSIVFYFLLKFVDFIFGFVNFSMVCYCKDASLLVSMIFLTFIFIALSIKFLSRTTK